MKLEEGLIDLYLANSRQVSTLQEGLELEPLPALPPSLALAAPTLYFPDHPSL